MGRKGKGREKADTWEGEEVGRRLKGGSGRKVTEGIGTREGEGGEGQ